VQCATCGAVISPRVEKKVKKSKNQNKKRPSCPPFFWHLRYFFWTPTVQVRTLPKRNTHQC